MAVNIGCFPVPDGIGLLFGIPVVSFGALVQAHPPSLPGYGFYLVALAQNVRHADIEAFATWMGTATERRL